MYFLSIVLLSSNYLLSFIISLFQTLLLRSLDFALQETDGAFNAIFVGIA